MSAELTKSRIRRGIPTIEAFREAVNNGELDRVDGEAAVSRHPRWVRVNTIKTTLQYQLSSTFAGYTKTNDLGEILLARGTSKIYFEDPNIPNLLALPSKVDLTRTDAYIKGQIIFQDKASCFPAYLLNPSPEDGGVIDGTAAPGNKTTHLAAIVSERKTSGEDQKVIAFERDKGRSFTLQKMVKLASADSIVQVKASSDFIAANPASEEFSSVGAILLDPSCSGTGIVGRDDAIKMHLPESPNGQPALPKQDKNKKRKRGEDGSKQSQSADTLNLELDDASPEETPMEGKLTERLVALASFQLHILTHAMRFTNAQRITYSTCSIHFEENEGVVFQALASSVAKERGWTIMKRETQIEGLRKWPRRGVWEDDKLKCNVDESTKNAVLDACIRCDKGTNDGTMGFFVAGFLRTDHSNEMNGTSMPNEEVEATEEEEWNGFSDAEASEAREEAETPVMAKRQSSKKTKRKKPTLASG